MSDLENFSVPDGSEWWKEATPGSNAEKLSEKFRESIKKWAAWTGRTQKDEKKAKKYDFLLSTFLVKILLDKKYDDLLENIFMLLDEWYPSNFILGEN